jgi:hypothetical protein
LRTSSSTFAVSSAGGAVVLDVVASGVDVAVPAGTGAIGGAIARVVDEVVATVDAGVLLFDFIIIAPTAIAITAATPMRIGTIGAFFCGGAAAGIAADAAGANDVGIGAAIVAAAVDATTGAGFISNTGSGSCARSGSFVARRCMKIARSALVGVGLNV